MNPIMEAISVQKLENVGTLLKTDNKSVISLR